VAKIVITGGAGFIGSHIGEASARAGHEVVLVDDLNDYYAPELKKKNIDCVLKSGSASFVKMDITDIDPLKKMIKKDVDYVFHEAAQPGTRISVQDPFKPNNVNVLGTLNVLQASLEAGVKRVINASSCSVYGKAKYLPFDENHPTEPISPYGVSKLAAEHYCRVFYDVYGLLTVSLRYFTVYGPRMRPDLAISIFTRNIFRNKPITIFGDGNQTRDFTYVEDVVKANMKLLETNKADGKVLNIGSGNRVSINDLVAPLREITGLNPSMIYTDSPKGDAEHTHADVRLASKLIGYRPDVSIQDGLKTFVKWFQTEQAASGSKKATRK
jgi:UDP-glucose 4-epimerase